MYTVNDFNTLVGSEVSFNIYGQVGGSNAFNGTVLGTTLSIGVPSEQNIEIQHANIYPDLPDDVKEKVKNDPRDYQYVIVKSLDTVKYFGIPWIISDSVQNVTPTYGVIKLDNFSNSEVTRVRSILENNGYKVKSLEVIT